jgi:hypothetical protein
VVFASTAGLKPPVVVGDVGTVIGTVVVVVVCVVGTVTVAVLPQPTKPKINIETMTNAHTFFIVNS